MSAYDSPVPMYRMIADHVAAEITDGRLAPGQPIPSESELQQQYRVARATARRAVAVLAAQGLVVTVPQRGSYVADIDRRQAR